MIRHQRKERRTYNGLYTESWTTDKSLGEVTREILEDENFPNGFKLQKDDHVELYEHENSHEIVFLSDSEHYQISARGFENSKNTEMTFLYLDSANPEINSLAEEYRDNI